MLLTLTLPCLLFAFMSAEAGDEVKLGRQSKAEYYLWIDELDDSSAASEPVPAFRKKVSGLPGAGFRTNRVCANHVFIRASVPVYLLRVSLRL